LEFFHGINGKMGQLTFLILCVFKRPRDITLACDMMRTACSWLIRGNGSTVVPCLHLI